MLPSTDKWVKNLSETPLTKALVSLLAHGPNFAIAPQKPTSWRVPHHCGASMPVFEAL